MLLCIRIKQKMTREIKEHKTNECEQNQHYTESNLLFIVSVSIKNTKYAWFQKFEAKS